MADKKRPMIMCHEGTGTGVVARMLEERGMELRVVKSREVAHYCHMDGLILLGGADIHPFWYGEDVTYSYGFDRNRDMIEYTLVRRAMADGLPIMGICRGMQMINVIMGGTLYQDIDQEFLLKGKHGYSGHALRDIDPLLLPYLPSNHVNSLHHQAVREMPYGFKAMARSPEGIIESIWRPGVLGVQWHPELLVGAGQKEWGRFFDWYAEGLLPPVEKKSRLHLPHLGKRGRTHA